MSFNALSLAKLGVGFGALAVASIGFLVSEQVEAEHYVASPTIVFQQLQPTYTLLPDEQDEVFILDAPQASYVFEANVPLFTRAGVDVAHVLQAALPTYSLIGAASIPHQGAGSSVWNTAWGESWGNAWGTISPDSAPRSAPKDAIFVLTTHEITPILQLTNHISLLHVNKSNIICQTTARELWPLSSKP